MKDLMDFLRKLEEKNIYYELKKFSQDDLIMVQVDLPGERWEIEFNQEGIYHIDRFVSSHSLSQEEALDYLWENFSN